MEIFGEKLVAKKADLGLLKVNGLDRLPSPQDLQGKIILKGTEPSSIPKKPSVRIKKCIIYYYIAVAICMGQIFTAIQKVASETICRE